MLGLWKSAADRNPKCPAEGPASMNAVMEGKDEENHKPRRCQHFTSVAAHSHPCKSLFAAKVISTWAQIPLKLPGNLDGGGAP